MLPKQFFPFPTTSPSDQNSIINAIKRFMKEIQMKNGPQIERQVQYRSYEILNRYNIDMNSICDINGLRYILMSLMVDRWDGKGKQKKTNIRIDFDFSEVIRMLEKKESELDRMGKDQLILEEMEHLLAKKDDKIEQLERQIFDLKNKSKYLQNELQNLEDEFQHKLNDLVIKCKQEKGKRQKLQAKVEHLTQQNQVQPQQFYRRCLLTQALSIENYLLHS